MLTAAQLKVGLTLHAAELLAITAPNGKPHITLRIRLPDRPLQKAESPSPQATKNNDGAVRIK